ncbi:MAG: ATP-binding protein [Desulfobacterales bacterium]|nr:ATP-binding protein [Desulfobacterales bacterium]
MSAKELQFKISSALKNIIGRDLITDDLIAVFELIKNSFDAYAKNVEIIFTKSKLVIKDDGKGMEYDDLINKWLFVAYSAKSEGIEDVDLKGKEFQDYRDKIKPRQYYAGAKGVGRFSCDRLGSKLILYTKSPAKNAPINKLIVDWDDFEKDTRKEFVSVKVKHETVRDIQYSLENGTILEISGIRDKWKRDKILKLKHSLGKLINPYDYFDEKVDDKFSITIKADHEIMEDLSTESERDKVNGPVKNFIFETLNVKTTQVVTRVSADGKYISTELIDRGKSIYKTREKNVEHPLLRDIRFHLFYLNRSAKLNFNRLMGINSVSFGSVFLYKNGFRVFPYGEEGEDSFKIDRRHAQGYARTLGLRDIIGRIEITGDNEQFNEQFKETTSRDGGLIETPGYYQLVKCFFEKCFKRLERYVVDIQWSIGDKSSDTDLIDNKNSKAKIIRLISKLVNSEEIELVNYNKDFLNIISDKIKKDIPPALNDLKKLAIVTDDQKFLEIIVETEKEYKKLKKAEQTARKKAEKAEEARSKEEKARKKAEEAFEAERKKNLFFNALKTNSDDELGLIHQIKLTSQALDTRVKILVKDITSGQFDKSKTLEILSEIKLHSEKVLKLSEIITVSDFNFKYSKHRVDLPKFIEGYVNEIRPSQDKLDIYVNPNDFSYVKDFSILELSVIIDNLISNSIKAKSRKAMIKIDKDKKRLKIVFSDDGNGVKKDIKDKIFEPGFTTTVGGSGIGLYTVKDLLEKLGGYIQFIGNGKTLKGASFEIGL